MLSDGLPKSKHGWMPSLYRSEEPYTHVGARNPHNLDRQPMTGR